ncbi:MAG: secretin N-terminal domain-containing protein [Phycisphaerae bacterium]
MNHRTRTLKTVVLLVVTFVGIDIVRGQPLPPNSKRTRPVATKAASQPTSKLSTQPKTIPLSFNNAPLRQIADFLTAQMGKPVIIRKEIEQTQVTLVNPKPLPVSEALSILTTALNDAGVAIEERDQTIHLIPITAINQSQIKTIPANVDVRTLKPTHQIVRKIFELKYYDPAKLTDVLKPLLPAFGHITADSSTNKLMIVATVDQLITLSMIITEFDKPDVTGGELRVFHLNYADVYEIIPMLEKLISGYLGVEIKPSVSTGGPGMPGGMGGGYEGRMRMGMMGQPQMSGPTPGGQPSSGGMVSIKGEKKPILIIPDPRRASIVVAAPTNVLIQIEKWLLTLDQPKPKSTQMEIIEVQYGDVDDLTIQLNAMLTNIPDDSLRNALKLFPFSSSRRLMIVGSEQNRKMIKEWLKQIDIQETGQRMTKTVTLKYADAQQVVDNIKELFSSEQPRARYYFNYGDQSQTSDRTKVSATANVRINSVTVVASPEKMKKIEEQIAEWDKPFSGEEAAPRIYNLTYADPDKTKELLENLFTKKEAGFSWMSFWGDGDQQTPSPVGRLFGQFRFESYRDAGKLIVISKNEENYKVIDDMIAKIDQPQSGGVPRIIQLKFAEAENLAEQLNALLNSPGTPASILRRSQSKPFESFPNTGSPFSKNNTNQQQQYQPQQNQQQNDIRQMQFWWQSNPAEIKIKQPSNLVGKLRIVPNVEQNLLMVAAPDEYVQAVEKFVRELDKPGSQVMIKAVIAEITHEDATSLGYRFSSDPSLFTSGNSLVTENALRGLLNYKFEDTFGRQNTLSLNVDVNNLISLLRRVTDLKIKSEPKILTADNIEAEFFDGQDIPFISSTQTFDVGTTNQQFDYFPVGIRLRVRPHITKDKNVDLTINLLVSSVVPGKTLFGGAIVDRRETTTRILLKDGRTFLISGILREENSSIIRRIPGLGDIPILGELFKHREISKVNSELLIFLTPYVIGPEGAYDQIESKPQQRMEQFRVLEDNETQDELESDFECEQPTTQPAPRIQKNKDKS